MKNVHVDPAFGLLLLGMKTPHFKVTRDLTMFMLGAAAFIYETLEGTDRPNVLYGSLALMGVAAYLRGVAGGTGKDKGVE